MIASTYIAFASAAFASVASASAVQGDWVLNLLKRQEPGTPAFACHSVCGSAVTLSRGADPCNDQSFLTNYQSCLECAHPDNVNIWRYYGATLTTVATRCGLSTTPVPGSSATITSAAASTTPVPGSSAIITTSAAASTTPAVGSTTTTTPPASPTPSPTTTTAATPSSAAAPATASAPSATRPVGNGTATSTSISFTGAANAQHIFGMGAIGVAVFALLV